MYIGANILTVDINFKEKIQRSQCFMHTGWYQVNSTSFKRLQYTL